MSVREKPRHKARLAIRVITMSTAMPLKQQRIAISIYSKLLDLVAHLQQPVPEDQPIARSHPPESL